MFVYSAPRDLRMNRDVARSIIILLLMACATSPAPPAGPVTAPLPLPSVTPSDNGPWSFQYRSDTVAYQVTRSGAIESQTDSGTRREIVTNNAHEVFRLTISGDTTHYSAVVDSFSTATQGLVGTVQQVKLPVEVSGFINSASSTLDSAALESCDPVQSSLQTDARNLLLNFPAQLSPGQTWRDSSARIACYGTIPMRTSVIRRFSVLGRTSYHGQSAVAIQRMDSITAHGDGRQQQHRLVIDAGGDGSATYYLSPPEGVVIRLVTDQNLEFAVQASGRTNHFRESTKQEYSLVR